MEKPPTIPVKNFLPAALLLAGVGWSSLLVLILFSLPTLGPRWLFFFTSVLALCGTLLPLVAFLNRRFPTNPPATAKVIIRETILLGVYLPTLAWMQIGRVLTPGLATLLAVGLLFIEILLRLRERAQWRR